MEHPSLLAILSRIKEKGARNFDFTPHKKMLFDEYNKLVGEGHIKAPIETNLGCGSCNIKVAQGLLRHYSL